MRDDQRRNWMSDLLQSMVVDGAMLSRQREGMCENHTFSMFGAPHRSMHYLCGCAFGRFWRRNLEHPVKDFGALRGAGQVELPARLFVSLRFKVGLVSLQTLSQCKQHTLVTADAAAFHPRKHRRELHLHTKKWLLACCGDLRTSLLR